MHAGELVVAVQALMFARDQRPAGAGSWPARDQRLRLPANT